MKRDLKYLQLLAKSFPTVQAASTEIINLEAILNLPKGTEHFVTDLHGENEAFDHVLRTASGVIKRKVEELFGNTLREVEKRDLCTLIYYPEGKLKIVKQKEKAMTEWYKVELMRLIKVCAVVSSKYTRSKVRKALPPEYSYIIEELLHESKAEEANKHAYIMAILETIVSTGRADHFIIAICNLIKRLTIDSLHIIGDIYDRGPGAHIILDTLCNYHNFDIQWGNHDLVWMGAACGSEACVANVLRMCFRYANFATLEEGYGINLLPLATFAMDIYKDDPCTVFRPKINEDEPINSRQEHLVSKMHKAISVIQFKLEGQIIARREEFGMEDRRLLHLIDYDRGTISINGAEYRLKDANFPTIAPERPYELTAEERDVIEQLTHSFTTSSKLARHMHCLYDHGSLYLVRNSNLLYHGSVPLNEDGSFKVVRIEGRDYSGKSLFDKIEQLVRSAYFGDEGSAARNYGKDFIWYLWCGPASPPFDKDRMATFERYFLAEKELQKENKGVYYTLKNNREICEKILLEFGITQLENSHIINGHIPVKTKKGETPIKAGGKLLVIDGGFCKAYHKKTGIAGYTLIFNSHGLELAAHEPFKGIQDAIEKCSDIHSRVRVFERVSDRMTVAETDTGEEIQSRIDDLKELVQKYRQYEF